MKLSPLRARFHEVLGRLAAPAEEQIATLRKMGVWPSSDELALELDDLIPQLQEALVRGEISRKEHDLIINLNQMLNSIGVGDRSEIWDARSLESAEEWRQVRRLASLVFPAEIEPE